MFIYGLERRFYFTSFPFFYRVIAYIDSYDWRRRVYSGISLARKQ